MSIRKTDTLAIYGEVINLRLSRIIKDEIRRKYEETDLTQDELAFEYYCSRSTIARIVKGIRRLHTGAGHASLNILTDAGVQVDSKGNVYGLKKRFYYAPLDNLSIEPSIEMTAKVNCPHCNKELIARNLVTHLIKIHKRFDLEYLL